MDNFINTCWWLIALYLMPTLICVGFCFYKGENPFRRDFESRHYVFLPLFNILVAAIIVFAVMPDDIIYHIKNNINNIKKWKRKE